MLTEPRGKQQQDRGLAELFGAAEHIAGLATDLALCEPRIAQAAATNAAPSASRQGNASRAMRRANAPAVRAVAKSGRPALAANPSLRA
jgi:hypothetical protein